MKKHKKTKNRIKALLKKSIFLNSFRLDRRFLYVLALDFLFIILFVSMIALYSFILRYNLDLMKPLDDEAEKIQQMMAGQLEADNLFQYDLDTISSALRFFFLKMVIVSILFLSAIFLLTGFIKVAGWSKLLKEKLNRSTAIKFSLLVLIWNMLWILILSITVLGLRFAPHIINIIAVIEFFIYIYFSLILTPIFFRSKNVIQAVKETFRIGASKFYVLIQSVLAVWLILSFFLLITINLIAVFPFLFVIISATLLLVCLVWIKFYMNDVIKKIYT